MISSIRNTATLNVNVNYQPCLKLEDALTRWALTDIPDDIEASI